MLFRDEQRARIVEGLVTLAYRWWKRPRVREGSRLRFNPEGIIAITRVDALGGTATEAPTTADARRAGYGSREALLQEIDDMAAALGDVGARSLFRVEFAYEPEPDPRTALAAAGRLSAEEIEALRARLEQMDVRSSHGPWTLEAMRLIETSPRVLAATLAREAGRERLAFKADVRKLKALGLTISHERGYELSPRGRALLAVLDPSMQHSPPRPQR